MRCDMMVIGNTYQALDAALTAGRIGMRVALLRPATARDPFLSDVASGVHLDWSLTDVPALTSNLPATGVDGKPFWDLARRQIRESWEADRRVIARQLQRYGIYDLTGKIRLETNQSACIFADGKRLQITADRIILATGTVPEFPTRLGPFGGRIITTDEIWNWTDLPQRVCVVARENSGVWHAGLCARLGAHVMLINGQSASGWQSQYGNSPWLSGVTHRPQSDVLTIQHSSRGVVTLMLSQGEQIRVDGAVIGGAEVGAAREMVGNALNMGWDEQGRLWCDPRQRTWEPNVLAAGTIAGFPSEAQSVNSGRTAVCMVASGHRDIGI